MKTLYLKGKKEIAPEFHYYAIDPGWFGTTWKKKYRRSIRSQTGFSRTMFTWSTCRDDVQAIPKTRILRKGLFFSHSPQCGDNVVLFLQKIEEILKLEKRSSYKKTNLDYSIWIKVSPWWLETLTKRSFLTLILRIGMRYDVKESMTTTLSKSERGRGTLPAIKRFLRGFTKYVHEDPKCESDNGWVTRFYGKTPEQVRKLLIK
jgi:hypothetical protein